VEAKKKAGRRELEEMEVEYGAKVIDSNGKVLGTVDHLIRNTWTGGIIKFAVHRKAPDEDLFFATKDVVEATKTEVKLNISFHELSQNAQRRDA
jgi:sporulation protein YlmC with PRC-barrel domain